MKDIGIIHGRATLALLFLGLVGALALLRIGNKRGTPVYRVRIALWSMAVMLTAGTAVLTGTATAKAESVEDVPEATMAVDEEATEYADQEIVYCYCTVGPWH
jgi:hypothetical protein